MAVGIYAYLECDLFVDQIKMFKGRKNVSLIVAGGPGTSTRITGEILFIGLDYVQMRCFVKLKNKDHKVYVQTCLRIEDVREVWCEEDILEAESPKIPLNSQVADSHKTDGHQ